MHRRYAHPLEHLKDCETKLMNDPRKGLGDWTVGEHTILANVFISLSRELGRAPTSGEVFAKTGAVLGRTVDSIKGQLLKSEKYRSVFESVTASTLIVNDSAFPPLENVSEVNEPEPESPSETTIIYSPQNEDAVFARLGEICQGMRDDRVKALLESVASQRHTTLTNLVETILAKIAGETENRDRARQPKRAKQRSKRPDAKS